MMLLNVKSTIGVLGMGVAGVLTGAAAGSNVATDIGLLDPEAFGITVLVMSLVGAVAGSGMGLATFCCEGGSGSQKTWKVVKPGIAQVGWLLLAAGTSLPYLALVASATPYLSHFPIIKLGGAIFLRVAGLVGTLLWVDGVVLQLVLAYRVLRK